MTGNYPDPELWPDEGEIDDEYIYARDVLEGEELAEQLKTGRTRIRRHG